MIDKTQHNIVQLIARGASWLAPIPSAWFVGQASYTLLEVPAVVAVVVALVVELQGLALTHTALDFYRWNRDYQNRSKKWQAPTWIPAALFGIYLLTTWSLAVLLKVWPDGAAYAPGLFPLLALTGTVNLALEASHAQRQRDRRNALHAGRQDESMILAIKDKALHEDAEDKAKEKPVQEIAPEPQETDQELVPDLTGLSTLARRVAVLKTWEQGEGQNFATLAPTFGVKRQTISNDFAYFRSLGKVLRDVSGQIVVCDNGVGEDEKL